MTAPQLLILPFALSVLAAISGYQWAIIDRLKNKLALAKTALQPFAELCEPQLQFDDPDIAPGYNVHCMIMGEGELGDLKTEHFLFAQTVVKSL